jgi:hypothetical protein
MTEQEWLTSTELEAMFTCPERGGLASERKGLLLALACLRRVWPCLSERSREAVEVLERLADRLPADEEREAARRAAERGVNAAGTYHTDYYNADYYGYDPTPANVFIDLADAVRVAASLTDALHVADCAAGAASAGGAAGGVNDWLLERAAQAALLRDLFGPLPFHRVSLDPAWLTWNDGTVVKMAQVVYEERAFDRLPVLADALEEAGCTSRDILDHLRGPGPHVRGCWAVDLLLGKE